MTREEEQFYEIAGKEIETNKPVKAIFVKAYSDAEGNKEKTSALYIKYRVEQLKEVAAKETKVCSLCNSKVPVNLAKCHCGFNFFAWADSGSDSNKAINPEEKLSIDKKKSRPFTWSFLLWWKTNPEELKFEVDEYKTLKITQSSRGISFLYLIFAGVVSLCFNYFAKIDYFWVDCFIVTLLGYFIWRGHRWAMILAMVYWTFTKWDMLYGGIMGNSYGQFNFPTANVLIQIFWWAIFMQMFYKAFRVECLRRKK